MPRLFRRSTDAESPSDDTPAETNGDAAPARRSRAGSTAAAAPIRKAAARKTPARKTPARKTTAARKTATARKATKPAANIVPADSGDKPSRRRGSRGGGGRTRSGNGATAASTTATATGAADPAAAPQPAQDDAETEFLTLLRGQSQLLERQNQLLQSLIEVQGAATGDSSGDLSIGIKPRMALFVDVPNILYAAERSGVTVDWEKTQRFLARGRTLVRSIAYAPISDDPDSRREMERFVLPFLDKDYRIVTKPLKRFSGGGVKANFDVELAIDILTMADRLDVIGLISGDGDFRRLIEIVSARGVRVEVAAFGHSTSHDLREVADRYIDIAAYVPELCES